MRQDDAPPHADSPSDFSNGLSGAMDLLSPLAHNLLKLNRVDAYTRLVMKGQGNEEAREMLDMLQPDQLLSVPLASRQNGRAMLAGLWLWHDWLDQSHAISQDLHDATGSFWHAMLHRREGDFSNSKYWFTRAGRHTIYPAIGVAAGAIINPLPADKSYLRLLRDGWDPGAFVDLVEEVSKDPHDARLPSVVAIQRIEWQLLFDHCARQAAGR